MTEKRGTLASLMIDYAEKVITYMSIISTAVIMLFITLDVFFRYFLNSPITGAYEITEDYLMVMVVFLALSYTYSAGAHVRVTLFLRYIPERMHFYIDLTLKLISLAFFILVFVAGWENTLQAIKVSHRSSSAIGHPMAPAFFVVPLGIGILCLRIIQDIVRDVMVKARKGIENNGMQGG